MPRWKKTAIGVALIAGAAIIILASILIPGSHFVEAGRKQVALDTYHVVGAYITVFAGLMAVTATIYAFVWVLRHMLGRERTLWAVALVVFPITGAIVWWWRIARPLPESAPRAA
jgi:hypothetical protein